jgi:hypothetical protein
MGASSVRNKFKKYQSKPIERLAYQIKETDGIVKCLDSSRHTLYFDNRNDSLDFVAHEKVNAGDYIVYLNDDDVYHCNAKVFAERNIIESEH